MSRRLTEADFRDYATPAEIAAVLGISREAVVMRANRDQLPYVQTPLGKLVHVQDVLAMIRERRGRGIDTPIRGLRELRSSIAKVRRGRRARYER